MEEHEISVGNHDANERGTKTVFTYAHVKWFYGQSERAYYLNYFIKVDGETLETRERLKKHHLYLNHGKDVILSKHGYLSLNDRVQIV